MIKLLKVLFGLYFFVVSLTFACDLRISQLNIDEDRIQVVNNNESECSWDLEISWNVYSSTSFGKRVVNEFVLKGWDLLILGNETGENKIKLSPSLRLSSKGGIVEIWLNWVKTDFQEWGDEVEDFTPDEENKNDCNKDEDIFGGNLKIEEIHPRGNVQYIELVAYGNVKWRLEVKGLWRWKASKSVEILLWSGNRLILVDTPQRLSRQHRQEGVQVVYIPGLSLKDSWEELELYLNGDLTAKLSFPAAKDDKSFYFGFQEWDLQVFDRVDIPSPALDLQFFKSLKTSSSTNFSGVKCGIKWQHTNPIYGHNSLNLIALWGDEDLSNQNTKFECEWTLPNGQKIDKCNPSYISNLWSGLFKIKLTIKKLDSGVFCETFSYLNLPSKPTTPSCKEKYYQNLYLHRKEKYHEDIEMSRQCRQHQFKSGKSSSGASPISIEKILPNPYGKDDGKEKIRFKTNKELSLEGYFVKINGKKTRLHGVFGTWKLFDIQWNLKLTNYGGCIELGSGDFILQKVCYLTAPEWKILSWEKLLSQLNIESHILKSLSISKIKIKKDKACLVYHQNEIKCEPLKYTYQQYEDLVRQKKKLEKEISKLTKQITKNRNRFLKKEATLLAKIASLKKKAARYKRLYNTYKQKSKNNYYKYLSATRTKNQKIKTLSRRIRLYKEWNKYVKDLFKTEWYPLWKEYDMSTKYEILSKLDRIIAQGKEQIVLKNQTLKPWEIKSYFQVYYTPSFIFAFENTKREVMKNILKPLNYLVWYTWP